jgi:hypothetical protein
MIYHDTKDDIYVTFNNSWSSTTITLDPNDLQHVYNCTIYSPRKGGKIEKTFFGKTELDQRLGVSMFPVTDEAELAKLMMLGLE